MVHFHSRFNKLGGTFFLQEQSEVVVSDLDLLCKALVPHLKLHVVPGELRVAKQIFVNCERSDLILQCLTQLFSRLVRREEKNCRDTTFDIIYYISNDVTVPSHSLHTRLAVHEPQSFWCTFGYTCTCTCGYQKRYAYSVPTRSKQLSKNYSLSATSI